MNPITKALDEVKYRIPRAILNEAFKEVKYSWRSTPVSLDEQILNKVIRPRVLTDCNIVGGIEVLIPLNDLPVEIVDQYTVIIQIPKSRTQNRTITSVQNVGFMNTNLNMLYGTGGTYNPMQVNELSVATNAAFNSFTAPPAVSTARVSLIAENTIMIRDTNTVINNNILRCSIADDENMNHLQMRSILAFSKLVELAVKAYIYNVLIIEMDMTKLEGGQELGRFKEVVDEYKDAEDMYQEYLIQKWQRIAFMNDSETQTRLIKMMIGGMK